MKESKIQIGMKVFRSLSPDKGIGTVLSKDDIHPVLYQVEFPDGTGPYFAIELDPVPTDGGNHE